ncbi:cysteine hydrolase family protein [Nostoc sp.]|uniref:cysteine hydrolase family protein n=1 Tax=Nostoc sp. TaxID=1180 RepID=UPI0035930D8B
MDLPFRTLGVAPNAWTVNNAIADITRLQKTPQPVILSTETKTLRLDLAKSAILVIDMQNDFCHPDGWLAHIGVDVTPAHQPIEPLNNLLPELREAGVPVIWLNWGNRPDLLNISAGLRHVYNPTGEGVGLGDPLPSNDARVLMAGSWAAAVVDELELLPEDICVDKYRMSGFWDTPLDSILRNLGTTTIFFAGVNADQCVLTTLCDANFLGYDCVLVKDCTATTSPEYCWLATLYNVKQCFGFVTDSQAILTVLQKRRD